MTQANINDRTTIEQIYPRAEFDADARANARAKDPVRHGVRITSAPDAEGRFGLTRASRHTGEKDGYSETVFLAPYQVFDTALKPVEGYAQAVEVGDEVERARHEQEEYERFIDRVIEAAKSADFEPPLGRDATMLQGFHGG